MVAGTLFALKLIEALFAGLPKMTKSWENILTSSLRFGKLIHGIGLTRSMFASRN